jgi:ATP/maltotriose-dependent transcriptional regulator MalT
MRASPRLLAASTLNHPMRRVVVVAASRSADAALSAAIGERQPKRSAKKLSARELEVLHLVAEGFRNDEIAQRLFISPKTVKTHLQNIYEKWDVKSRTEAAMRAKELGLLG